MGKIPYISAVLLAILLVLGLAQHPHIGADEPAAEPPRAVHLLRGVDYVDTLRHDLAQAQESISVLMYACVLPDTPRHNHPVRQLLDGLIAADRRGVAVRVLFDQETRRDGSEDTLNNPAADYLAAAGVTIHRDEADRRTHTKTVVIDRRLAYVGSANWTWSAFHRNREHSLRVLDPLLGQQLTAAFTEAWAASQLHRR